VDADLRFLLYTKTFLNLILGSSGEKENIQIPSTSSKVGDNTTSGKKSLFKKIGTRKLILMNKGGKTASPRGGNISFLDQFFKLIKNHKNTGRRSLSKVKSPLSISRQVGTQAVHKKMVPVKSVAIVATPPNRMSSPR